VFLKLTKMGYIKHHTIVVTGWEDEHIEQARKKAIEIFENQCKDEDIEPPYGSNIISQIIGSLSNGQRSFFIAPDGSKEGWETSNNCNNARKLFLDWLRDEDNYCDYIEVMFGGDDDIQCIVRSNDFDLDEI
jgi:hypothetical protein